jgi:aryl-alcohol dehydrogenase-like predicted oxidoreductase
MRRLGNSGLVVSVVGLGSNNLGMKLDMDGSREVMHAAVDEGITLFDTPDSSGTSEERLGELLQGKRDDVVIGPAATVRQRARNVAAGNWHPSASDLATLDEITS